LILTGAKITEEDIEEEELDELELIYEKFYNSVPDRKDTIIDDIVKESAHVDKYLRNGLMYSLE
jgi:F0F1-type ATP synthase gamma subunit